MAGQLPKVNNPKQTAPAKLRVYDLHRRVMVRRSWLFIALSACLTGRPAQGQSAKAYYDDGESAFKDGQWLNGARDFELAAKLAPGNKLYQSRYAEVRIEASKWAVSAARLLLLADRKMEARPFLEVTLHFDPDNSDAANLLAQINEWLTKFESITSVYVGEIKGACLPSGNNQPCAVGEMAREQIKTLLANTGRFQVLGEAKGAAPDATISGRAALVEVETQATISAQPSWTTAGPNTAIAGTFGKRNERTSANRVEAARPVTSESVVLSLTNKDGEVIWGWDDTRACNVAKVKCAVNDLLAVAAK